MSGGPILKPWLRLATPELLFNCIRRVIRIFCRTLTDQPQATADPTTVTQPNPVPDEAIDWEAVKRQTPAGSALFREIAHFTPFTSPKPDLDWSALEGSVNGRKLTHLSEVTDWKKLAAIENEVLQMKSRSTDLHKELDALREVFSGPTKPDEYVHNARRIHREINILKVELRKLLPGFQKHCLQLPNVLHPFCPTGDSDLLLRSLPFQRAEKLLRWSQVENDVHHTLLGTYLTGRLAELERLHLARACRFHQKSSSRGSVQTIKLSDLVRGPALEGSAWFPMDSVLRLQPSRSDLRSVPRSDVDACHLLPVGGAEVDSERVWLVNPHTTSYLVGSASLPAFAAYLMLNELKVVDPSALPFQLVTQGSEYRYKPSGDKNVPSASVMDNHGYPFQQRKLVSLLEIYANSSTCEKGFHDVVEKLATFWSTNYLSWPLKLVYSRASQLRLCESLRVSLLLDFSANAVPIKLASVSMLGDWVSRRVSVRLGNNMTAAATGSPNGTAPDYAFMVYAKVLNSTSLITAFHEMGYMSHSPEEFPLHEFSV